MSQIGTTMRTVSLLHLSPQKTHDYFGISLIWGPKEQRFPAPTNSKKWSNHSEDFWQDQVIAIRLSWFNFTRLQKAHGFSSQQINVGWIVFRRGLYIEQRNCPTGQLIDLVTIELPNRRSWVLLLRLLTVRKIFGPIMNRPSEVSKKDCSTPKR